MSDELAEINGITPSVLLEDGEEREASSQTSNSVYKIKRTFDHYYCSCPAWRNQGGVPVNARTCKHLKSLLGDKYEAARIKMKNPDGPPPKGGAKGKAVAKAKPASKASKAPAKSLAKRKRADEDDEDEEDEDDEVKPASKRGRKVAPPKAKAKPKGKVKMDVDEEDEEDEAEDEDDNGEDEESPKGKSAPELLLAVKWEIDDGPDPTGWWVSEKLDGVRAFFDGTQFISRLGNPFYAPDWFIEKLPNDITLDGELYGGRGEFQSTVSVVKTMNSVHWKNITFQIFDVPSRGHEEFEARYKFLEKTFGENGSHSEEQIVVLKQEQVRDKDHIFEKLKEVENAGGEGLMLRKPKSLYEGRRSNTLQKIKTFHDAEAVVTGYTAGKGRNKDVTGALKCKMASGKNFNVGTGLSDKVRKNPPKIGSIIVYRFQELTKDGVPRFPSYVGVAVDKTEPKDAEIPDQRRAKGPNKLN